MRTPTIGEFQQMSYRDPDGVSRAERRARARLWNRVTALLSGMCNAELSALEAAIIQKKEAARMASVAGRVDSGSQ